MRRWGGRGEGGLLCWLQVCRQPLRLGLRRPGGGQEGSRLQEGAVNKEAVAPGAECPPSSPSTFGSGFARGAGQIAALQTLSPSGTGEYDKQQSATVISNQQDLLPWLLYGLSLPPTPAWSPVCKRL